MAKRRTNTIFEDTREARLYQGGNLDMIANRRDPQQLYDLRNAFFYYTEPACAVFDHKEKRRRILAIPHCEAHYDHA